MANQTERHSYTVHLRADVADELGVESPISTDRIDYYDSGLWVTRESGRDFYPYGHILTIQEREAGQEPGGTPDATQAEAEVAAEDADEEEED